MRASCERHARGHAEGPLVAKPPGSTSCRAPGGLPAETVGAASVMHFGTRARPPHADGPGEPESTAGGPCPLPPGLISRARTAVPTAFFRGQEVAARLVRRRDQDRHPFPGRKELTPGVFLEEHAVHRSSRSRTGRRIRTSPAQPLGGATGRRAAVHKESPPMWHSHPARGPRGSSGSSEDRHAFIRPPMIQ